MAFQVKVKQGLANILHQQLFIVDNLVITEGCVTHENWKVPLNQIIYIKEV